MGKVGQCLPPSTPVGPTLLHRHTHHHHFTPSLVHLPCPHLPPQPYRQIINPSETFGEIVVDYNHVECSSACITALTAFRRHHPAHRVADIERSLRRGISYIKRWGGAVPGVVAAIAAARGLAVLPTGLC